MQRSFVHILLSLLLLLSQQVGMVHGYTHANELQGSGQARIAAEANGNREGKPAKGALVDLCVQCAASAQMAFALPTVVRLFLPVDVAFNLQPAPRIPALCLLTRCVFDSRAPPASW